MKYLSIIFLPFILLLSSCRTVSYSDKAGNKLQINSFLWDTQIGSLIATNGTDSINLTNYNSQPDQAAIQLADDVIKSVPALAASKK